MNELARLRFVIALRFTFETFLDGLLDLGQTFKTVLQRLEPLVGTVTRLHMRFASGRAIFVEFMTILLE